MGICAPCGPRIKTCGIDPSVPLDENSCLRGAYYDANDSTCKACGTT